MSAGMRKMPILMMLQKTRSAPPDHDNVSALPHGTPDATTAWKADTRSPAKKGFQTIELTSNILLYLPAKTIFDILRVSRCVGDAIPESPEVKRKLFLRIPGVHSDPKARKQHSLDLPRCCYNPELDWAVAWKLTVIWNQDKRPAAGPEEALNPLFKGLSRAQPKALEKLSGTSFADLLPEGVANQAESWQQTHLLTPSTSCEGVALIIAWPITIATTSSRPQSLPFMSEIKIPPMFTGEPTLGEVIRELRAGLKTAVKTITRQYNFPSIDRRDYQQAITCSLVVLGKANSTG
jgi:hypothetical protein